MTAQDGRDAPIWNRPVAWAAIVAVFLFFVWLLSGVLLPFVVTTVSPALDSFDATL